MLRLTKFLNPSNIDDMASGYLPRIDNELMDETLFLVRYANANFACANRKKEASAIKILKVAEVSVK